MTIMTLSTTQTRTIFKLKLIILGFLIIKYNLQPDYIMDYLYFYILKFE